MYLVLLTYPWFHWLARLHLNSNMSRTSNSPYLAWHSVSSTVTHRPTQSVQSDPTRPAKYGKIWTRSRLNTIRPNPTRPVERRGCPTLSSARDNVNYWWRRSVVVNGVGLINEVNRDWARLVLGWVTAIVRENVWSNAKKRKKSRFLDFEKKTLKNVKNITVVTCRPIQA